MLLLADEKVAVKCVEHLVPLLFTFACSSGFREVPVTPKLEDDVVNGIAGGPRFAWASVLE